MTKIQQIVKQIKQNKLNREIDETGAGGFWDLAYEITGLDGTINDEEQEMVERVYNAFWEIVEAK